jgi:hypothetical protein
VATEDLDALPPAALAEVLKWLAVVVDFFSELLQAPDTAPEVTRLCLPHALVDSSAGELSSTGRGRRQQKPSILFFQLTVAGAQSRVLHT